MTLSQGRDENLHRADRDGGHGGRGVHCNPDSDGFRGLWVIRTANGGVHAGDWHGVLAKASEKAIATVTAIVMTTESAHGVPVETLVAGKMFAFVVERESGPRQLAAAVMLRMFVAGGLVGCAEMARLLQMEGRPTGRCCCRQIVETGAGVVAQRGRATMLPRRPMMRLRVHGACAGGPRLMKMQGLETVNLV